MTEANGMQTIHRWCCVARKYMLKKIVATTVKATFMEYMI